jgi:Flp pilus assembly protein TadG
MKASSARRRGGFTARLLDDERGVSSIEFALLGGIVFILIVGTVELAIDMMMDASVQIAAQQASRAGLTTTNPNTGTRAQAAQDTVTRILSGWASLPNTSFSITEVNYGTYANVGASNGTAGLGGLGDVVSYNIVLTTQGITGIPRLFGINSMTFQRSYIVQNEK